MRRVSGACFLLFWILLALPAAGQDSSAEAFFGTYQGSGIANTKDSAYFGITMRDLDVVIGEKGSGFAVQWTTVIRQNGAREDADVRRKSSSITFLPTENPHRFKAKGRTDPLDKEGMAWARIEGDTLTVYVQTISSEGKYDLQKYARTISGRGMSLAFTRIKDGEQSRTVKGKLIRVED